MKMLKKHGGTRLTGFTLIELLTVIVIIGVLAGMISTAVMLAKRKSLEVARDADLVAIKSALEYYRYEYQEWPCDPGEGSVYEENNHKVIAWMTNSAAGFNERKITFLNIGEYRRDESGNLVDYNGNEYKITFDLSKDTVKVE